MKPPLLCGQIKWKSWPQGRAIAHFSQLDALIFKNVIFEKNHCAPSEVAEVKRSFSRSPRPNFGFHLVLTGFDLEFSSFWVSRSFDLSDLGDLRRGSVNFFKNYIFEISASSWEKWAIARPCGQNFHLICPQRRCDYDLKRVLVPLCS